MSLSLEQSTLSDLLYSLDELTDKISFEWADSNGIAFQRKYLDLLRDRLDIYLNLVNQLDELMCECDYVVNKSSDYCTDLGEY